MVNNGRILPFAELRQVRPLWMTQDLQISPEKDNLAYADELADRGLDVVPIRKRPLSATYQDRPDFPRRVIFEMTSRCNFFCRMCPQHNLKRPRVDMLGKRYRSVIDEIDKHGIEGLWLYHLGESLLHPEFEDNIRHLTTKKNLGVIWMSTNGRLFTEKYIRLVLDSKIDFINFSAHAVTEKTYDTVAPPGNFSFVQENLRTLYRLKGIGRKPKRPFLHVQMIEQETTKHEIDAFIEEHHDKAEIISVNMLEYVNLPNNAFGTEQRQRSKLKSCLRVTRNDCFICSNGEVTLCDAAYNGEISLGNVHEQSLHDIWSGKRRMEILSLNEAGRMGEVEFCRSCTDYDI